MMQVFDSLEAVPHVFGPRTVTIGKFDGVHRGHRAIVKELLSIARTTNTLATVVTFDRHPLSLLAPHDAPHLLTSTEQKLHLLHQTGVDAVVLIPFTHSFAQLSPEEFVNTILIDVLHAHTVLVGEDFRFGKDGAGTVKTLHSLALQNASPHAASPQAGSQFTVQTIPDVHSSDGHRVSSTEIRKLLKKGDIRHASEALGSLPTLRGEVIKGAQRGRDLGFPTANLSPESEGFIPANGVYAGWLTDAGERYPAAISVGNNPTFEGVPPKQVEAYVLDAHLDLYGHRVDISFVHHLRDQIAFTSIEPLIIQMQHDVEQTRMILAHEAHES